MNDKEEIYILIFVTFLKGACLIGHLELSHFYSVRKKANEFKLR